MRADYYQLLDVAPTASPADIKAAYYRLAKRYHPDHNDGNPAAEERFKLISEAYRTLGLPERRREYDDWLRLHDLYHGAPELEQLSSARRIRPFRYSERRARERQARRTGRADSGSGYCPRRRVGGLLIRPSGKVNTWLFGGFYALVVLNLLPIFVRHMFSEPPSVVKPPVAGAEESEPCESEVRRRVLAMEQNLRERAEAGEAAAQYQLGLYLFNKSCRRGVEGAETGLLRRAANAAWREDSLRWLCRAAQQGHGAALRLLRHLPPRH